MKEKEHLEKYQTQVTNPKLADCLLGLINPKFASNQNTWLHIAGNHRISGGSLEAFMDWSSVEKYDRNSPSDSTQMERAWERMGEGCKGIPTLERYVFESGRQKEAEELIQHFASGTAYTTIVAPRRNIQPKLATEKTLQAFLAPYAGYDYDYNQALKELEKRSAYVPQGGLTDTSAMLHSLYAKTDLLFLPFDTFDNDESKLNMVLSWDVLFHKWYKKPQFIIPNPHCGVKKLTTGKEPKLSIRADACFDRQFLLVEFDKMPLEDQARLWLSLIDKGCNPASLVYSGSKSIHALIRVNDEKEFETIFDFMVQLGCDPACRNKGRLSRLAGVERDNGKEQALLYLGSEPDFEVE